MSQSNSAQRIVDLYTKFYNGEITGEEYANQFELITVECTLDVMDVVRKSMDDVATLYASGDVGNATLRYRDIMLIMQDLSFSLAVQSVKLPPPSA